MPDVGFGYPTPKIRLDPDFAGSRSDIRPSLLYSDVHTLKNKAERLFSHSAVFPDKFPDISRFCSHPKLFNLRKINWDNSLSVTHNMVFHVVCTHGRDVVSVLNVSVLRRSRDVFWNVSVSSRSCDLMSSGHF